MVKDILRRLDLSLIMFCSTNLFIFNRINAQSLSLILMKIT